MLKRLDTHDDTALLIQDFDHVLARERETRARLIRDFFLGIQRRSSFRGNPVVITSSVRIQIPSSVSAEIAHWRLTSFTRRSFGEKVLLYWCDSLHIQPPVGEGKQHLLDLTAGYPLAIRLATALLSQSVGLPEMEEALQDRLEPEIVSRLLSHVRLSEAEQDTAAFMSIFRGRVTHEALMEWGGEQASDVAARLTSMGLVEKPVGEAYVMHPLLRRLLLGRSGATRRVALNKSAAAFFERAMSDLPIDMRHRMAAELVYHLGEAGQFGRQVGLRRSYLEELKPIARRTYLQGRNDPDAYFRALGQYKALDSLCEGEGDVEIKAALGRCYFRVAKIGSGQLASDPSEWSLVEPLSSSAADSGDDVATRPRLAVENQNRGAEMFDVAVELASRRNRPSAYYVYRDYAQALVAAHRWPQDRTQFEKAEQLFETAAELYSEYRNDPDAEEADLVAGVAYMHMKQGDEESAIEGFRRATDMQTYWDNPYAPYWLCRLLLKHGETEQSRAVYERLKNIFDDDDRLADLDAEFREDPTALE